MKGLFVLNMALCEFDVAIDLCTMSGGSISLSVWYLMISPAMVATSRKMHVQS